MLHKTPGIVLKTTPYSETSVVTKIYTLEFGVQTYLINGVRSAKAKFSYALLQPLTLLDLVVYYKENKPNGLQRIAQMHASPVLHSLQTLPQSVLVAMFVAEVLGKCLPDTEPDELLYHFIYNQVIFLDNAQPPPDYLPLFLLNLSEFLGFKPYNNYHYETAPYFSFISGTFEASAGTAHTHARKGSSRLMGILLQNIDYNPDNVPKAIRQEALFDVLKFYKMHVANFGTVHTLNILIDIW
jgi:DNA repair protein RecO (recombination protein O)